MGRLVTSLGLCGVTFQYLTKTTVSLCFPPPKSTRVFFFSEFLCISLKPLHLTLPQNLANFFSVSLAWNLSSLLAFKFVISATYAILNLCRVLCLPAPVLCSAKPWYFTLPVPAGWGGCLQVRNGPLSYLINSHSLCASELSCFLSFSLVSKALWNCGKFCSAPPPSFA